MKKVLVVGLALLGVVSLTGCDQIVNLFSGEKQYNYDDFKALLADRKLSFTAVKCESTIDEDGEKTSRTYTYNNEDKVWEYTYTSVVLGEEITSTGSKDLDVITYAKKLELTAAFLDKKTDEVFKFYATADSYKITGSYKNSSYKAEVDYRFGKDGLMISFYEKSTDLDSVESTVKRETFVYSDN